MTVDRDIVERVAELAHIGLEPEEIPRLAREMSAVLEHVGRLQAVDTAGVVPTSHVVPMQDVMRADEVAPSWPVEAVLANAPYRSDDLFQVQAVLE
ncbi:MAG: Asp-tRNA(Asn)/Glu-tRNA(Gln) amidotransferase subunit GatC [Chloroflexota bacterium]|nr:Asp-tRNA(Asn)/Glu-tRNA(Gln) amidotransferase subunit GatC [Chloroflexota bacterium]